MPDTQPLFLAPVLALLDLAEGCLDAGQAELAGRLAEEAIQTCQAVLGSS